MIEFGDITIRIIKGIVYLETEGGEAMQVKQADVEKFTKLLQEYYDREF